MNKFQRSVLVLLTFLSVNQAFSQIMDVKVKVVDKAGKVYSMAVVLYYEKGKSKESFNVQKASRSIADAAGIVYLKVDSAKNYFFRTSWVGYQITDTDFNFS